MTEKMASQTSAAGSGDDHSMSAWEEIVDILRTVVIAVAITLFVRFFLFQPFNIPSGSMKPTLLVGDFILVDKIEYGYSKASLIWPLTRAPIEGRVFSDTPERGEIIVFKNPADKNKDYIKRVIGMPGDRIQIKDSTIHINGVRVLREQLSDTPSHCVERPTGRVLVKQPVYRETLPNGVSYIVQECEVNTGRYDNTVTFDVPEAHYFMMGDNRDNSEDSRSYGVGSIDPETGEIMSHFVALDQVVGRARRVAFSVDGEKASLIEIWNWPRAIRYGRLLSVVE